MFSTIKDSFIRWIERKQALSNKCGVWPFEFSEQHAFTPACVQHDNDYARFRQIAIDEARIKAKSKSERIAALFRDEDFIRRWLRDNYRPLIKQADKKFAHEMTKIAKEEPVLGKKFTRAFTQVFFNYMVLRLGWPIWERKTLEDVYIELGL